MVMVNVNLYRASWYSHFLHCTKCNNVLYQFCVVWCMALLSEVINCKEVLVGEILTKCSHCSLSVIPTAVKVLKIAETDRRQHDVVWCTGAGSAIQRTAADVWREGGGGGRTEARHTGRQGDVQDTGVCVCVCVN